MTAIDHGNSGIWNGVADAEVLAELADVTVTAMVAGPVAARTHLASRMLALLTRIRAAAAPLCPACGGDESRWQAKPVPGGTDTADSWSCQGCGHEFTITVDGFTAGQSEAGPRC